MRKVSHHQIKIFAWKVDHDMHLQLVWADGVVFMVCSKVIINNLIQIHDLPNIFIILFIYGTMIVKVNE